MRLFFPATADVLTDHAGHGEGLIAWQLLSAQADRGHDIVACTPRLEATGEPPFEVVEIPARAPFESLRALEHATKARGVFRKASRSGRFHVVHWLFPQGSDELFSLMPRDVPLVVGPLMPAWPRPSNPARLGDAIRLSLRPVTSQLYRRTLAGASARLVAIPA